MSKTAAVSVIIPAYNSEGTIGRALSSVLAQTLQPLEVIVVDDASTDNTTSVVEEFARGQGDHLVRLVQLDRNRGCYYARNAGWEAASGEFLAFLDADDSWHPHKLEIQAGYMLDHAELDMTVHRWAWLCDDEAPVSLPEQWSVTPIPAWRLMMFSCSLCTPSIMVKRGIPHRFDSSKRYSADRLFLLQVVLHGQRLFRLDLPLAYIHKAPYGAAGLSSHLLETQRSQLDNFTQLRQAGLIGRWQEIPAKGWSVLKYMRRVWVAGRR